MATENYGIALGMIETRGLVGSIEAADAMYANLERTLGDVTPEGLLGLDEGEVSRQVQESILGQMRLVIATLSIEPIEIDSIDHIEFSFGLLAPERRNRLRCSQKEFDVDHSFGWWSEFDGRCVELERHPAPIDEDGAVVETERCDDVEPCGSVVHLIAHEQLL